MPASNTESLLSGALSKVKYRHPDQTRRDVLSALHHYRGLIPKQDKFIFNDGVQRDLINIYGTIPVPYKGQNYNIPISLWLLDTHPYHAPICYIKPTADMQIKVSKHVDHSGKIYLPYLHEWANPNSDLLGLIQICIVTFSEQPPVYSKPKDAPALPYPVQAGYGYQQAYPPPQYPQYNNNPPAYPMTGPGYPPTTTPGYPPYPPTSAGYPPHPTAGHYSQASTGSAVTTTTGTITQEHLKASILSAVEDKVKMQLREDVSAKHAETESLKQVGEELSGGQCRLSQMISKLKLETDELDTNIKILTEKEVEMSAIRNKLADNGEVDCDEAVTATAPVYKQLINAYAEEAATEDAIYFLGEALRRGVIDSEVFLKNVRNLSRKQFLLRATMQKCRQMAGLGP
eukprot:GFUD01125777.1.p1 GENE.GFUD01125777.1~~GFUD01125777.1.p1  ORF type:complete len:401 (-),score=116.62 GFUD01125777.1:163-1365(-)